MLPPSVRASSSVIETANEFFMLLA